MGPLKNAEVADLRNHGHVSPLGSAKVVLSCDNAVTTTSKSSKSTRRLWLGEFFMVDASEVPEIQQQIRDRRAQYQ